MSTQEAAANRPGGLASLPEPPDGPWTPMGGRCFLRRQLITWPDVKDRSKPAHEMRSGPRASKWDDLEKT